jgi:hypothetical protein
MKVPREPGDDRDLSRPGCSVCSLVPATWSRAGGARLDAIAGMLGHSSVTTTGIHARIADKIAENPARYLGEILGLSLVLRALPDIVVPVDAGSMIGVWHSLVGWTCRIACTSAATKLPLRSTRAPM